MSIASRRIAAIAGASCIVCWSAGPVAASDRLARWFGALTCPTLDGLTSATGKQPPYVKTGRDDLIVSIAPAIAGSFTVSMTQPWYVYDPRTHTAFSHVGGDSGVRDTLRVVAGPPPSRVPIVDLAGGHTISGLKIGSTAAAVVAKLGTPRVVSACGLRRFEYTNDADPSAEPNDLDFTIREGRVIEIFRTSDG